MEFTNKFSVCMSVYKNDNITDFVNAVMSVYNQSIRPNEIILVIDGPVSKDMYDTIRTLENNLSIMKVLPLEQNMGHAVARQTGLEAANNDLCAIMDADDLSVPDRFEKQLKVFKEHQEVSVVGGLINEFIHSSDNVVGTRWVPERDAAIKQYMKSRCPMNLVSVMMKKDDVMKVGGYQDWYCEEDYYLWIRLSLAGCKFYNIQENLVNVRVGDEMYHRRGGIKYFKSEAKLQKYMLDRKIISWLRYIYNILIRFVIQVAIPNRLRGWVFQRFARK